MPVSPRSHRSSPRSARAPSVKTLWWTAASPSAAIGSGSASSAPASPRPGPGWQGSAMGLTSGTGPFGNRPAGRFNFTPDPATGAVLYFDPVPYRLRGLFAGETVFDTLHAKLLYETAHLPVYYVPEDDLRHELL